MIGPLRLSRRSRPASIALDFLAGGSLSLGRASVASYHDAAGVMQMAPADAPRFDHDPVTQVPLGLLIEGAATNLYIGSDAPPSSRNITMAAQQYTLSFWGAGTMTLSGVGAGAAAGAVVGLGANVRTALTFMAGAGNLSLARSGAVTKAQLEVGTRATSYIPTTSVPATRSADALAPLSLSALWAAAGAVGGTILMDVDADGPVNTTRGYLWMISEAGLSRLALRGWNQGVTDDSCALVVGDGAGNTDLLITTALRGRQRIAASYINGAAPMVSLSGAAAVTSARSFVHDPATTTITIGGGFYGHLRGIRIYRRPMTGAQLQALTA